MLRETGIKTSLLAAALITSLTMPAYSVDLSKKPIDTPTLDYLHNNNIMMPPKKDENGNEIEGTSVLYPESGYSLTAVSEMADNVITKYVLSETELTPQQYAVVFKKTTYSPTNVTTPDTTLTYHVFGQDVNYKYDSTMPSNERLNVNQQGADVTGDFINNFTTDYASAFGGAIFNNYQSSIGDITGDFINNSATSTSGDAKGGAIFNIGAIGDITGDFINNSATSTSSFAYGGAIYNGYDSTIGNITGDFINNSVTGYSSAQGGAIFNTGTIGNITGDFINNSATGSQGAYGGAIFNHTTIGDIAGNFINNSATGYSSAQGGAIYNHNTIGDITGDFINNYVASTSGSAYGGAIYNSYYSTIGQKAESGEVVGGIINSSFINNSAVSESGTARGGAIYTRSNLNIIAKDGYTSVFDGNYTQVGKEKDDNAIFVTDSSALNFKMQNGGKFLMKDNIAGAVDMDDFMAIEAKGFDTFEDWAKDYDSLKETALETFLDWEGFETIDEFIADRGYDNLDKFLKDESFETLEDYIADYDGIRGDTVIEQLLYYEGYDSVEEFLSESQGYGNYTVNIEGDDVENTTFYLLNDIKKADVTMANTTINTINNLVHEYNFNSLTLKDNINFVADVDLAAQTMDRFTANNYGEHKGNLNVIGMNILSDAPDNRTLTEIYFAQQGLKDNVTLNESANSLDLPQNTYQTTAYTPIFKYNVAYDNRKDAGYFVFAKGDRILKPTPGGIIDGGSTGNSSDAFNPSVLSSPVSGIAAAQATVNETFKYVFEHADAFTQMPLPERMARLNANKYALSTTFNHNLGSLCPEHNNNAAWVRPYTTFENMNLKNGPKVDAITYGTLVGFDTNFFEYKKGWYGVGSGYLGYNGSQLSFKGVDTNMNGGLLGYTHTLYKGNFWTALTLSAGASVGESQTMYGKEDFTNLMAGVGSKTGYNFEFKDGKYILQPIMFMSYTFVNTFDYTNAAGVKINTSPAHSIQLNPSVRFITNFKNGWQPYASVGMVWNVMNENKVMANNVRLPEMGMKPYVEYGLGVQRNWKDKFTAFGQAMIRNGGRNGIALTAGFRWAIGHEHVEKVHNDTIRVKKVLKELPQKVSKN